uniref:Uncharacterized protein n=1 Tax=Candidatus Kentrum sp. DK TaxID=2126562 RepID=A0A450TDH2_9GAMM|nr:MAG: hypothetical protein BECKDK2373C_GA0170839_11244 [Candidatus Kentron sp. DK]
MLRRSAAEPQPKIQTTKNNKKECPRNPLKTRKKERRNFPCFQWAKFFLWSEKRAQKARNGRIVVRKKRTEYLILFRDFRVFRGHFLLSLVSDPIRTFARLCQLLRRNCLARPRPQPNPVTVPGTGSRHPCRDDGSGKFLPDRQKQPLPPWIGGTQRPGMACYSPQILEKPQSPSNQTQTFARLCQVPRRNCIARSDEAQSLWLFKPLRMRYKQTGRQE